MKFSITSVRREGRQSGKSATAYSADFRIDLKMFSGPIRMFVRDAASSSWKGSIG